MVFTFSKTLDSIIGREMESDIQKIRHLYRSFEDQGLTAAFNNEEMEQFIGIILSVTRTIRVYDRDYNILKVYGTENPENEDRLRKEFSIGLRPLNLEGNGPAYIEVIPTREKLLGKPPLSLFLKRFGNLILLVQIISLPLILIIAYYFYKSLLRNITTLSKSLTQLAGGQRDLSFNQFHKFRETSQISLAAGNLQNQLKEKEESAVHRLQELTHDLKGPIAGLFNQLESVELGAMEMSPERFNHLYRELGYLNKLIDDMSALYKLEDSMGVMNCLRFNTEKEFLIPLRDRYTPLAEEKGIDFYMDSEVDQIYGDPHLLIRATGNLIHNAILYGKGMVIDISIYTRDDREVIIEVRNQGQISKEDMPLLFTRYWRKTQDRGGSGLGLSISKMIARKHGGDLTAENQKPDQVVFKFSLPVSEE